MPCNAFCIICNQIFSGPNASSINTLWNDNKTSGRPICWSCIDMKLMHTGHINYDIPKFKRKKKGLDRWVE